MNFENDTGRRERPGILRYYLPPFLYAFIDDCFSCIGELDTMLTSPQFFFFHGSSLSYVIKMIITEVKLRSEDCPSDYSRGR